MKNFGRLKEKTSMAFYYPSEMSIVLKGENMSVVTLNSNWKNLVETCSKMR